MSTTTRPVTSMQYHTHIKLFSCCIETIGTYTVGRRNASRGSRGTYYKDLTVLLDLLYDGSCHEIS